jgi:hypothetical protein
MLRLALAALLFGFLPGALIFRAPVGERRLRAALAAEERLFWSVLLSVTWSVAAAMALAAFGAYRFDTLLWVNGGVSAAILLAWRARLGYRGEAPHPTAAAVVPVVLLSAAAWLFMPASEYVIGGKDPGTYLNEGASISRQGTLTIPDPDVAAVPAEFRELFFPEYKTDVPYYGLRFMGFFIIQPDSGTVMGQFPHWFPASIAIADGFGGVTGMRTAIVGWALVGLAAVYFAGAQAFGRFAAAAGTALLAINVVEVWFARYPNSELPMQAMLFGAVLAFHRAADGSRRFFGTAAALLVSLGLFLRYDAILAIAALTATATLIAVRRQHIGWSFGVVTAIVTAVGLWYLAVPMKPYSDWYLEFTRDEGWWILPAGALLAVGYRRIVRDERAAAAIVSALPVVYAGGVVALATYAYFFRFQHGRLAEPDAAAFRTFAWYVTRPGLLFGVIATAWLARRSFWRAPALFIIFAIYSAFFFYKMRIVPDHFWAARRFVSITVPGMTLLVAALATDVFSRDRCARWLRPLGIGSTSAVTILSVVLTIAALVPLGTAFASATAPIRDHVEYAGMTEYLRTLISRVGPNDLLLIESRRADSDVHVLAPPLAYIYGRHVLVLDSVGPDKRQLEAFVDWASTRYDHVLFLGAGGTDLLTRRVDAVPIASERFQVPEYASVRNGYPEGVRRKEFDFGIYRLVPAAERSTGPIDLSLGAFDDLNVVNFYAKEQHSRTGELFRWTKSDAWIMLLGIGAEARTITLWMSSGGRPPTAPPATVSVAIGGRPLGSVTLVDEVRPYTFAMPADVAARAAAELDPVPLSLKSTTWNPHALVGGSDVRSLGVMVTRVQVK